MEKAKILSRLKTHTPKILGSESFSKYAIMLPLIQKKDGIHVLFEVRSFQLRRQPGEICFPGGRIDSDDKDELAAAIRETKEELGISVQEVSQVFPLDFMISPFGMMIYPFVGFINSTDEIRHNPEEVAEIFTVPLSFFTDNKPRIHHIEFKVIPEADFPFDLISGGKEYNWRSRAMEEYFYLYEDKVIWGLTARILAHFIELIKS